MKICAVVLGNVNTLFSKARSRGVHFMALNSKCTDVGALAVRCADRRPRRRSSHFSCVPSQIHLISRLSSPSFACIEYAFLPEEETIPYPSLSQCINRLSHSGQHRGQALDHRLWYRSTSRQPVNCRRKFSILTTVINAGRILPIPR
jgi:hypothetical protein